MPVNKSNTNCLAVLTSKYKPSVNIQPLQARAALSTSGLYFSEQNNQTVSIVLIQHHAAILKLYINDLIKEGNGTMYVNCM